MLQYFFFFLFLTLSKLDNLKIRKFAPKFYHKRTFSFTKEKAENMHRKQFWEQKCENRKSSFYVNFNCLFCCICDILPARYHNYINEILCTTSLYMWWDAHSEIQKDNKHSVWRLALLAYCQNSDVIANSFCFCVAQLCTHKVWQFK